MSGSCYITKRATDTGEARYVVRYRRGGRYSRLVHAGSKKTLKEARILKQAVDGELAAGRDPLVLIHPADTTPARTTFREWGEAWLLSRHDLDETSRRVYGAGLDAFPKLASRAVASLTSADFETWVGEAVAVDEEGKRRLAPSTIALYMTAVRQMLDFAEVSPNPARSRRIRLPKDDREEVNPPPATHLREIFARLEPRLLLPLMLAEQCCLRVSEPETLEWRDVDVAGSRIRLRARETKAGRARWVREVPSWLMAEISSTCAPEDRDGDRRVFPGFTADRARRAMATACKTAEIPHYSPHDLRHRRATLWHHAGMPARELQDRGGWAKATIPLDVYSHVMPLEELKPATLRGMLAEAGKLL